MRSLGADNKFGIEIYGQCNLFAVLCSFVHFEISAYKRIANILQSKCIVDLISGCQHNFRIALKRNINICGVTNNFGAYIVHSHTKGIFFGINITKITRNKIRQKACCIGDVSYIFNNSIRERIVNVLNFNNIKRVQDKLRIRPKRKIINRSRVLFCRQYATYNIVSHLFVLLKTDAETFLRLYTYF